jgi:hypothetical protein
MGWVVNATPWPLYTRKRDARIVGGWLGLGPVWAAAENLPLPGIDPRNVHPHTHTQTHIYIYIYIYIYIHTHTQNYTPIYFKRTPFDIHTTARWTPICRGMTARTLVIAQQYSPATLVSLLFHYRRENFRSASKKLNFVNELKKLCRYEIALSRGRVTIWTQSLVSTNCIQKQSPWGWPLGWKTCSRSTMWNFTWDISEVLHTVCFLFKNEFILQNTFTGLQCNLHCALSPWSIVWASLVFLSGRLRCWCVRLLR